MNTERQAALARVTAWAIVLVATLTLGLTAWLLWRGANTGDGIAVLFTALFVGLGVVGTLIIRRARNQVGWIFVAMSASLTIAGLAGAIRDLSTLYGLPRAEWWSWWNDTGFIVAMFALPPLFLLFPDGHLPSPRWRWVARAYGLGVAIAFVFLLTGEASHEPYRNPTYIPWPPIAYQLLLDVGGALAFGAAFASIGALIVRYRRSVGEERLQMRWVVAVVAFGASWLLLGMVVVVLPIPQSAKDGFSGIAWTIMYLSVGIGLPVAVTIAVFRYKLYEIDVVIRKTVVVGVLALFITVVYVAIVAGIGTFIAGTFALQIAATAVVALAFQPVRERANRLANRLAYGRRATPYEVLARFADRIGETYASEDVVGRIARVIAEGTAAERAGVWLRVGNELRMSGAWPDGEPGSSVPMLDGQLPPIDGDRVVPVRHRGELLGAVALTKPAAEALTPNEAELLDRLAEQAGLVLSNVRMTSDLEARLEQIARQAAELRASRQRIVAAQDEERRRLERNIHDGAQQHLVALAVKLRLVRSLFERDPERGHAMLREIRAEVDAALDTLRALSLGIYPPLLEEHGIAPALAAQYERADLPVHLETDSIERHPIELEAAIYFSALEALQNAAKYAEARSIVVRLTERGGAVEFEVADDGIGFDLSANGSGTGLEGMRDRLAVFGGDVRVDSRPGRGTVVRGRVPVTEESGR